MLATLAVVVACALGAATLPVGAAATARAATLPDVVDAPAGPAGQAQEPDRAGAPDRLGHLGAGPVLRATPADRVPTRPAANRGVSDVLAGPVAANGVSDVLARRTAAGGVSDVLAGPVAASGVADALTRPAAAGGLSDADAGVAVADQPTGGPPSVPVRRAVSRPTERQVTPAGSVPATVGPRAPPAG